MLLIALGVFSIERGKAGAFAVPFLMFRVLAENPQNMIEGNVLCMNWYIFIEEKRFQAAPQNRILVRL